MSEKVAGAQQPISLYSENDSEARLRIGGRGVQSVEIGGRLLKLLADASQPMMLRDLATQAELTPGQAHAYLTSFRKLELVEQDAASGRYHLGPFALRLGLARLHGTDPYRLASEAVIGLAEELSLMVAVTVWGTHGPTIVLVQESSNYIHANVRPGGMFTVTGTATGKIFAAYLPPKLVEPVIQAELQAAQKGWNNSGALSGEALTREIEKVRRDGIAATIDLPVPGISALAAPIFNHSGHLQLAITVIGPTPKIDVGLSGPHAEALRNFTRRISAQLGYFPPSA
ncbi:MAG TPA: IclR family transcriptional regulator [Ferrovibrio sp.]|uniref:IclR family transcriptional regulator n=1 Tax=Ferrovibrio sp. TaxID=1917215 RepID=UPI002ED5E616